MIKYVMIPAALILLAAQATPPQFDLICPGTLQARLDGPREPKVTRIRIDLNANQWCFDDCSNVQPLAQVTASEIVLFDLSNDTRQRRSMARASVNRLTGAYRNLQIEARPLQIYRDETGSCSPGPFSGFPSARF